MASESRRHRARSADFELNKLPADKPTTVVVFNWNTDWAQFKPVK